MASDEFRLEIDLHDALHGLGDRLRALDLDDDVQERLGDRVIVTRDGERMYVYTAPPRPRARPSGSSARCSPTMA